jgi:hypothetical protein
MAVFCLQAKAILEQYIVWIMVVSLVAPSELSNKKFRVIRVERLEGFTFRFELPNASLEP